MLPVIGPLHGIYRQQQRLECQRHFGPFGPLLIRWHPLVYRTSSLPSCHRWEGAIMGKYEGTKESLRLGNSRGEGHGCLTGSRMRDLRDPSIPLS